MKKISKRKLELDKLTVRRLSSHDLVNVHGGLNDGDGGDPSDPSAGGTTSYSQLGPSNNCLTHSGR
jgi:hypothetical protein